MKYFKMVCLLLALSSVKVVAQQEHAAKIVGCWILNKMEFTDPETKSADLEKEAKNAVICFSAAGKFTTTKAGNGKAPIIGTYHLSADGKTLIEARDKNDEGVDDNATIAVLNEKELVLETEFGKMYFARKND